MDWGAEGNCVMRDVEVEVRFSRSMRSACDRALRNSLASQAFSARSESRTTCAR